MLKSILNKHGHLDPQTNDHYLSILETFPQDVWFAPTNENNDEFEVCYWFASQGLICKKDVPQFNSGSYMGMKKYYLWNETLNYKNV